jgi:hypothetical protein
MLTHPPHRTSVRLSIGLAQRIQDPNLLKDILIRTRKLFTRVAETDRSIDAPRDLKF